MPAMAGSADDDVDGADGADAAGEPFASTMSGVDPEDGFVDGAEPVDDAPALWFAPCEDARAGVLSRVGAVAEVDAGVPVLALPDVCGGGEVDEPTRWGVVRRAG